MRHLVWILALAFALIAPVHADVFVIAPATPAGEAVKQAFAAKLTVSPATPSDTADSVVIVVGPDNLPQVASFTKAKIVAVYLSHYALRAANPNTFGVVTDPSPDALADAIRESAPHRAIGFVSQDPLSDTYLQALQAKGLHIIPVQSSPDDLFKALSRLYETQDIDSLLIANDRQLFHSGNMSLVLESLFRKRIAAIAPIPALYRKGALLTVGPTQDAIVDAAVDVVSKLSAGKTVPRETYPDSTTSLDTKVNQFLARQP